VYAGLRVDQLTGNFHLSDPSTPTSGTLDADQAFSVSFSVTAALSTHQYASIQCAVLHTTTDGRRRVRVVNLALQVADIGANVFRFADMDVVVAHFVRQCKFYFVFIKLDYRSDSGLHFLLAMSRMTTVKISTIREELTELCSAILYSYRRNCAAATVPTQVRSAWFALRYGHLDNFSPRS
jgi:protein transport protein SEC24